MMRLLLDKETNQPLRQGSASWRAAKQGRFSASNFAKLISDGKKVSETKRINFIRSKAYALFLDSEPPKYESAAMRRGIEMEPEARFNLVRQYNLYPSTFTIAEIEIALNVGNCYECEVNQLFMVSPDGYDDKQNFGVELKTAEDTAKFSLCAETVTDNETFKAFDENYYWQVMYSLYMSGAEYWWFAYFLPELPTGLNVHAIKVMPDPAAFETIEAAIISATADYKTIVKKLIQKLENHANN